MNRSFFYTDFKYWLKKNRSRFSFIPYMTNVKKDSLIVQFHGLGNIVFLRVKKGHEFSMWTNLISQEIHYPWDWVADFDLFEHRNSSGYYCGFCIGKSQEFYKSREDMYEEHSYEPFLEWCNQNFVVGNFILNIGKVGHSGCSRFFSPSELKSAKVKRFLDDSELIDMFEIR